MPADLRAFSASGIYKVSVKHNEVKGSDIQTEPRGSVSIQ